MATTREQLVRILRGGETSLSDLAAAVHCPPSTVIDHLRHVSRSLQSEDETLYGTHPTCRDCGFEEFSSPLSNPSRCPACHSERLTDPVFTITRENDPPSEQH